MIKSPLRYPGGKSRAIKTIAPLIPEFREFREPFVGGGSVFFYVKQQFPEREFWINDLYEKLFHFWSQSQIDLDKVVQQINQWKATHTNGKALHRFLLEEFENFTKVEIAAAFFVLNRITFSGTSESGGFSNQAFLKRFTPSSIERLKKIDSVLAKAKITNLDFQEVIEAPGEEVFIFLDPPYYSASKSALYGKNGNMHKGFDHERLAEVMKNCPHKWLITYDNSPYIRDLFSFANIFTWELTYGMRNVKEGSAQKEREIFISNYADSNETQSKAFPLIAKK